MEQEFHHGEAALYGGDFQQEPMPEALPPMADLPGQGERSDQTIQDPCCMGSSAQEMIRVIQGFLEEEHWDRCYYQTAARTAPSFARGKMREIAAAAGQREKQLMAVCYLITGKRCCPSVSTGRIRVGQWCATLRECYHTEVCNAMNYIRAAEGTTDPCLERIFRDLGEASYRDAEAFMRLLEHTF